MKLQALKNAVCFGRRGKPSYKAPAVWVERFVHHDADPVRVRIMNIGQITHATGEVARGSVVRYFHMTPRFVRVEEHEQIGRAIAIAIAPVFAIVSLRLAWRGRDRFAQFT